MTGNQATLHFLIGDGTAMEQVWSGPIRCFGPDIGPDCVDEIGRLRRMRDRAVIAETLGAIIRKVQLRPSFEGIKPAIDGIAPKHQLRA